MKQEIKTFNDTTELSKLGSRTTDYDYSEPCVEILETFKNTAPTGPQGRPYSIHLDIPEWSGMCPKTQQPDFAHITITYIPDAKCIETKSLKLYTFAYRNYGCFMESTVNKYVDDFVTACDPLFIKVVGTFNARGGIGLVVDAEYIKNGYDRRGHRA